MSNKKLFWSVIAVFILGLFSLSFYHSGYKPERTIFDTTLNNDLDVVLKPWPSQLVSVQFWLRTGTLNEDSRTNGLAHFLEHMIFKKKELVSQIEAKGGFFNAATSHDFTYFYITIPKSEVKFAFSALGELLFANSFDQNDYQREQKVIVEEIERSNEDPHRQIYNFINRSIYGDHPYAQTVLGDKNAIERYTLTDLVAFYKKYYHPNNAVLVVTGGFNKKDILNSIKLLEKYPREAVPAALIRDRITIGRTYTQRIRNLTAPTYFYVYSVPGVDSEDSYTLDILMYLLGNRDNSLLNRRLKEELDLVYGVSTGYQTRKKRSTFVVELPLKNVSKLAVVQREYRQVINNLNISEDDLRLIKTRIAKEYDLSLEKVEDVAEGIGYYHTLSSYKYWRDYLVNINKVTGQDIKAVIKKYFEENSQFLFVPG